MNKKIPNKPGFWWYRYKIGPRYYAPGKPVEVERQPFGMLLVQDAHGRWVTIDQMSKRGQWGKRIPTHRFADGQKEVR